MMTTIHFALPGCTLLWISCAIAQANLGEVLDAKAQRVSVEQFRQQIVQRFLVGPSPAGGVLEVMYTNTGMVDGSGSPPAGSSRFAQTAQINGTWKVGDRGTICTTLRVASVGGASLPVHLPPRCQYWFKLDEKYYVADSDTDRSARVLVRTIKR